MATPEILIVEDDIHMLKALKATLLRAGYPVETAVDAQEARAKIRQKPFGLVLTDLRMPNGSGMEVLKEVQSVIPNTPVIVLTAYGTVESAVEAMKEGASDFIQKPFSFEDLQEVVSRSLNADAGVMDALDDDQNGGIITQDPQVLLILQRARDIADSKVPVLIQGESGTGKELLARYIHHLSPRREHPLVAINCAAIPENLLESELFGHEKGAFTGATTRKTGRFEQAHGSTLLMDEIGEMNQSLQAKLLRVVQEWQVDRVGGKEPVPVDVRVIATTNADLTKRVQEGTFREDLYFRLNVIPLTLPPLRERAGDIPILAQRFLERSAGVHAKDISGFTPDALKAIKGHAWKGNIREVKNVLERAVLLAKGPLLDVRDLWLEGWEVSASRATSQILEGSVKEVERQLILRTLEREGWNRTQASRKLGISIRTLRNKLQEYRREGYLSANQI